jgi:hypothetical protein
MLAAPRTLHPHPRSFFFSVIDHGASLPAGSPIFASRPMARQYCERMIATGKDKSL